VLKRPLVLVGRVRIAVCCLTAAILAILINPVQLFKSLRKHTSLPAGTYIEGREDVLEKVRLLTYFSNRILKSSFLMQSEVFV
jgi:hypothetical protein